jgi:hypothetical protein
MARIRNLTIGGSQGRYLVFVDGDCFVLADFIAQHRALAQTGHFVSGKRSYLRTGATAAIVANGEAPGWGRLRWF